MEYDLLNKAMREFNEMLNTEGLGLSWEIENTVVCINNKAIVNSPRKVLTDRQD